MAIQKKLLFSTVILIFGLFISWYLYYDLQYVTIYGKVTGKQIRNFYLSFPAMVENVYVTEGTMVEAGKPLLSLNLDDIDLRQKQIEYEIEKALTDIELENAQVARFQSDLSYSIQMHQRFKGLLEREMVLLKSGSIALNTVEYYQDTLNYYLKEQNDLNAMISTKTNEHATVNLLKRKIQVLRDESENIRSNLRLNSIHDKVIFSPVKKGVINSVDIKPGDIVRSDKRVLSILDLDSIMIVGQVSEKAIRFIDLGAPAKVILRTDYWKPQWGKVISRSEMAFQDQGNTFFKIEIDLDTKRNYILPNCNVIIKIRRKANLKNLFSL